MEAVFSEKKKCCGCSACEQACPVRAIQMKRDPEGFLYPSIDPARCVDCGMCQRVCPFLHFRELLEKAVEEGYAVKHRDAEVLNQSTSGGAFTALSDWILQKGGVIYGASFSRDWAENEMAGKTGEEDFPLAVRHERGETEEERNRFRFSKYVQSDMGNVFSRVEQDLESGSFVLFTGTPCQNAGLKSFCRRKGKSLDEHLILCDVICHSVPSPEIWKDYVKTIEQEKAFGGPGAIKRAQFRTKDRPWNRACKSFLFSREEGEETFWDDRYHRLLFQLRTASRPSCYICPFAGMKRVSDVTIADYWGIEKYVVEFMDARGVSLILTNTEKGRLIFNGLKTSLEWIARPAEEFKREQPRLQGPLDEPEGRAVFWEKWRSGALHFGNLFSE